jgi:hypothetical protein
MYFKSSSFGGAITLAFFTGFLTSTGFYSTGAGIASGTGASTGGSLPSET